METTIRKLDERARRALGAFLFAGIGALTACDDSPTEPSLAVVESVAVDSSGPLLRTLTVELDAAAAIQVDYRSAGSPRLRLTSDGSGEHHSLLLARLSPADVYDYEVKAVGPDGNSSEPINGSFSTGRLPDGLAALQFHASGEPSLALSMMEVRSEAFNGFVAIDQRGEVVWYWPTEGRPSGFTRRANRNFVFLDRDSGLVEVTPDRRVVARLPETDTVLARIHHDVIATPWNTVFFLGRDDEVVVNDTTWVGDAIWEWDPDAGTETRRWRPSDFLSPITDRGESSRPLDWLHANSLSLGPRGNVLISFRFLDQVISVASDFQSLEWRLGGDASSFEIPDDDRFYGQHTAAEVSPGRVLVFDNGTNRPGGELFSRALELELDTAAMTAAKVWEFRPEPDNYADFISSARRLDNGNTLVAFGPSAGRRGSFGPIEVFEVSPGGEVVRQVVISGADSMYRATPLSDIAGETRVE